MLLPSSLDGSAGGDQPLAGKTAGICWKVSGALVASSDPSLRRGCLL